MKKRKSKKKPLVGEKLGPCYACGLEVVVLFKNGEPEGLGHPAIKGHKLGPNGETGCAAYDAIGKSAHDMADFVAECRKNLEQKDQN